MLLYLFSRFLPVSPPVHYGEIEDSFIQFLHTAFVERLQFGTDVVYTYGPWGFLYAGYVPATHAVALCVWIGLSLVLFWAGWRTTRHFSKNMLVAWIWLMCFVAVAGLAFATPIDTRLMSFVLLLWPLYFFVEDRPFTPVLAALVIALGLAGFVKFNVFVQTVMVLAVISVDTIVRHRRFPWLLIVFIASTVFFWVAAGQRLNGLGAYFRSAWQITSGYTEAAMITGVTPGLGVSYFVGASLVVAAAAGYTGWARRGITGLIPLIALAAILFTDFKHGYVRNDAHEAGAMLELLLASLAVLAVMWPVVASRGPRLAFASFVPPVLAFLLTAFTVSRYHERGLPAHLLGTLNPRTVFAPVKLLFGTQYLRDGYEDYLAKDRADMPLPAIEGTVDTFPGNGGALLAHGMKYHPRPVMQSFAAFTSQLAERNAAFLRGTSAPDSVVFQVAGVDDHYPTLADGRSWPELLTRYDVQQSQWFFVWLKRSANPRAWKLSPLADVQFRFGETISIPSATNGPIWAEFAIDQSLLGKVVTTFYKPPPLVISSSTVGGMALRNRLVPGMARGGFLLSPLVLDAESFATIAAGTASHELAAKEVTTIAVSAVTDTGDTACYASPMRLRLYRLEFPAQDLNACESFRDLKSLSRAIGNMKVLHADHRLQCVYSPECGSVLDVSANSAFQIPAAGQPTTLTVGFGLRAPEAVVLSGTNGISFRVSAVNLEGKPTLLWSKRLDAVNSRTYAPPLEATIDLPRQPGQWLVLETVGGDSSQDSRLWCYWSKIEFR